MRELSLFTGAGGGVLGTYLLGWTPIGYVEWDDYCQRELAARIRDGLIPEAPIFGDVRAFTREGWARVYRGMADVVTAGFPCQPFSVAGKRLGVDDKRNMWPATLDVIREVRPRWVLLENVPGLAFPIRETAVYFSRHRSGWTVHPISIRRMPYLGRVFGDLAESGYDAEWRCLSAAEVGAPHKRDRLWIVAYVRCVGEGRIQQEPESRGGESPDAFDGGEEIPHAMPSGQRARRPRGPDLKRSGMESQTGVLADADEGRQQKRKKLDSQPEQNSPDRNSCRRHAHGCGDEVAHAQGEGLSSGISYAGCDLPAIPRPEQGGWWSAEPGMGLLADGMAFELDIHGLDAGEEIPRVATGIPNRVGQLRALGNGQVPLCAATAWRLLTEDLNCG